MTVEELANQCFVLVLAGHETTATTITSFIVKCIQNPSILTRCREEQDSLIRTSGRTDITPQDLKRMPYLDSVFRELERMHPAGIPNIIPRRIINETIYTPPDGGAPTRFKAGSLLFWDIASTNYDPQLYPNPHTFDPERWLTFSTDGNNEDTTTDLGNVPISNFKLATFSAGHRVCIGMQFARMEMMAIAGMLIREYDVVNVSAGGKWDRVFKGGIRFVDGVNVGFVKRGSGGV